MVKVIDVDETLALLEAVVAEAGSSHTARCYYVTPTKSVGEWVDGVWIAGPKLAPVPMCIVGQVVYTAAGVEGLLKLTEYQPSTSYPNETVLNNLGFTPDAQEILSVAQFTQDGHKTWGVALDRARRFAKGEVDICGLPIEKEDD